MDRTPHCPFEVKRPVMYNHWDTITLLHWTYDPDVVQALLPEGLEVETYDDKAWVALVPFAMRVRFPGVPHTFRFPETNVRTYVKGPNGRTGVWFFSLDAAHLPAVVAGRSTYALPYFWSEMAVRRSGNEFEYESKRRWPKPEGHSLARVTVGESIEQSELTDLELFLTARFELFGATRGGRLTYARAHHPPWELHRASIDWLDDSLVAACGLPEPDHAPLVHFSETTPVRIGRPNVVG